MVATRKAAQVDQGTRDRLQVVPVAIHKVQPHPRNPRAHSEENLVAICKSLTEFGQRTPIVVGRNNYVIKGCGTLAAARRLGWKTIQVVFAKGLTAEQEIAYAIADNQTTDLSEFDFEELIPLLGELQDTGFDLSATGFQDYELKPLLEGEFNPAPLPETQEKQAGSQSVVFAPEQWAVLEPILEKHKHKGSQVPVMHRKYPALIIELITGDVVINESIREKNIKKGARRKKS